jgi:Cdc6-like AAA superfamily ATPase
MPQIFFGRDSELSHLVQIFTQHPQAHAVLMGQGGAGKSKLALALMHHAQVKETFQQRFLVKCRSVKGSVGLLSRLASAIGLPDITEATKSSGYKETIFASLGCSGLPSLIVFDDLGEAPYLLIRLF